MWRKSRELLTVTLVALPMVLVSVPALAGISIEGKGSRPVETNQSRGTLEAVFQNVRFVAAGSSSGSDESSDGEEHRDGRPPKHPGDPLNMYPSYEYRQIKQGLITPEEAVAGCGGAQVAGGDATWGALALVGLFLALRRRK